MNRVLPLAMIVILFSCKKEEAAPVYRSLQGKWSINNGYLNSYFVIEPLTGGTQSGKLAVTKGNFILPLTNGQGDTYNVGFPDVLPDDKKRFALYTSERSPQLKDAFCNIIVDTVSPDFTTITAAEVEVYNGKVGTDAIYFVINTVTIRRLP